MSIRDKRVSRMLFYSLLFFLCNVVVVRGVLLCFSLVMRLVFVEVVLLGFSCGRDTIEKTEDGC